jgi:signal transduction histidine kinase
MLLALTAAVTTALVSGQRAAEQMVAQGLRVVETLADQSVLSLLYESEENAEKPIEAVMSFPDVEQAGVFKRDLTALLAIGHQKIPLSGLAPENIKTATLLEDNNQAWHFIAPIVTHQREELFPTEELSPPAGTITEVIGYAYVVIDKTTLHTLQRDTALSNIVIAMSFAVLLSLLVNLGINRMMRPLYRLIDTMEKNEQEQTRVFAELKGPKEFTHIASVFNRMMGSLDERDRRLREHGEKLESIVEIRTRELVTARDAALTASRHKSEFLANMSHELRTPLQAIIGYADVVREELEIDGMDEHANELNRVIRNANRLLGLINNILDMAKVESGKMDLDLQAVNLRNVLNEATDTVLPILRQNNNRMETDFDLERNNLLIDREKLLQMVLNLLSNAGKFTTDGMVTLISRLTPGHLVIKVSDTGIGLTEKQQRIIFDEFRQVDGSTTRDFEGTGLGLAITKRFADLMGGTIEVKSEIGKGSSFSIIIPLPISTDNQKSLSSQHFEDDEFIAAGK